MGWSRGSAVQKEQEEKEVMSKTAIALAHGHAAKWFQIAIYTLKATIPADVDIYVATTWPDHRR